MRSSGKKRFFRRGSAIATGAVVTAVVGVGVAALAVDSGLMFHSRLELQNAADSAALAAAMELGSTSSSALQNARNMATSYAQKHSVAGDSGVVINSNTDVVFGHASYNGSSHKYDFTSGQQPYDAVQVTARRDSTSSGGQVSLLFGRTFGVQGANVSATAVAMLVPRDIAVVIDLSGSMNDDSELKHYTTYPSETEPVNRPGVQINMKDVWTALPVSKGKDGIKNGSNPSAPSSTVTTTPNQPCTGPGTPQKQAGHPDPGAEPSGGSSNPAGPRWGWMTAWGSDLTLGSYSPSADWGLYYIPRNSTCTDADVIQNLTQTGYSSSEQTALLSGSNDGSSTNYYNRVWVCLGLAGWKSGKSGGKYTGTGNADNVVNSGELTQSVSYPFASGTWGSYMSYISNNTNDAYMTDHNFRYRYGIKTVVNYILEIQDLNSATPELAATPELPLNSVKGATQVLVDTVTALQTQDQMSLEIFGTTSKHEVNLTTSYQTIANTLNVRQSAHYDGCTNIGGGLSKAITELTSTRARSQAKKVIILMTDGKPNVNSSNTYVGNGAQAAVDWAYDRATYAAGQSMLIYTVAVGSDADRVITQTIASIGHGEEFLASGSVAEYTTQLQQIFQNLGGKRPVQLIR